MRFFEKLRKLTDRRGARSAKQHIGRVLLMRRLVFRVDSERIIASIDREKFEAIRDRYAVENPGKAWPKYLEIEKWITVNLQRVRRLELDWGRRKRVLDVGSGAGYFLYICKWLGHDVVGLDIDEVPMYPEMARVLGLKRVVFRIEPFVPLPDLGGRFDLITAFMICFNDHTGENLWGVREWDFFLDDVSRHLTPRGAVCLELNPQLDGEFMSAELEQFFVNRGAMIERHRVTFTGPPRPAALNGSTVG